MELWTALIAGLAGSAHCASMCGGISAMLGMGAKPKQRFIVAYNIGRISSYMLIALLFATVLSSLTAKMPVALMGLRIVAGVLMVMVGLFLLGKASGIGYVEKLGSYIWRMISPLARHLMPVDSVLKALGLGMLWGWLPCGLVYSMLAISLAQGTIVLSVTTMFAFGVGTLPALYLIGLAGARFSEWISKRTIRYFLAYCVMLLGVYTAVIPSMHLLSDYHSDHGPVAEEHSDHSHPH